MKRILTYVVLAVFMLAPLSFCAAAEGYTITLTPRKNVTLKPGATQQVSVSITPVNLAEHTILWTSENEYIASVSQKGVITAHAAGSTTVRAMIESGDFASLTVNVTGNPVKTLSIKETNVELTLGSTYQMEAEINATADDKRVKWFTDDDSIVTIDQNGKVTAVGYGTALITVLSVNGMTAQATVYVPSEVSNILIDPQTLMISPGDSRALDAYVFPGNARNRDLTWESSSDKIARVNQEGVVTAVKEGACQVRAMTENGVYALCEIIVTKVPSTLRFEEDALYLTRQNRKATLSPIITPENAKDALLSWESSDENVALVENGRIIAVGFGSAEITCTSENGLTAACAVHVSEEVTDAAFDSEIYRIYLGSDPFTPEIVFLPEGAADRIVAYSSSNERIASISEDGVVTPGELGKAVLSAQTAGGIRFETEIFIVEDTREINFPLDNYILTEHTTLDLTVVAQSESAVVPKLKWQSSIPSVCAVIDGTLYAQSEGATVITASTEDGALRCMCTVTVIDNPTVQTKTVALTFDNGPDQYTQEILDALDAFGVKATFFLLGKNVQANPKLAALFKNTDHEIGNHTYANDSLNTSSVADISKSLARTDAAIMKAVGREATVLRAPDANLSARLFATFLDARPFIGWSKIIPDMLSDATIQSVREATLAAAYDTSILVLHESSKATSEALYELLQDMILGGYRFVTVSELRELTGDTSAVFTTKP
ncbi:MAG: Ig-like domain-containing protein [Clostridia bacterium]|nr:Ig-like domain-containing protein [Clostridia bacterium]